MSNKPNWIEIEKCQLWRVLGVTECDNCNSLIECWGTDSQLPGPERTPEQLAQWEQTIRKE